MRLASYVLSFCLHLAAFLLMWFWPSHPPIRLDTPPVMISLVEGAPGGNRTLSPILGHMGEPAEAPKAPTPPAPKNEIAAPAREEIREPAPVLAPPKEATPVKRPELKPEPKAEPKPTPVAEKNEDLPRKKEPSKDDTKKQEKKEEPKKAKQEQPKKQALKGDPVAAALQKARKATSRAESGDRGNAIEQALAQAQRKAGGNHGGGGGEGDGPGGGGLGDVYMGQVMLAVRPNWGFASAARANLACSVRVRVDMQGKVLQAELGQSSGNAQYDASAVNAVVRTGQARQFPPPPSADYTDLELVFSYDELMGR
ncbi:cell envelope integrity protein TolA [uncultured Desulfovibrio sp.]|uniref:cell envelope integrity protein TolA n=1 Tax=uncultured Desulfovibrio sp. TaxID=167968 RepID=UPI0003A36337|nr:cell envelope integrity protein TolA [uncultured Desulfovibrio sp.]